MKWSWINLSQETQIRCAENGTNYFVFKKTKLLLVWSTATGVSGGKQAKVFWFFFSK